jgi:hypothetical protein
VWASFRRCKWKIRSEWQYKFLSGVVNVNVSRFKEQIYKVAVSFPCRQIRVVGLGLHHVYIFSSLSVSAISYIFSTVNRTVASILLRVSLLTHIFREKWSTHPNYQLPRPTISCIVQSEFYLQSPCIWRKEKRLQTIDHGIWQRRHDLKLKVSKSSSIENNGWSESFNFYWM